MNILSIESSCDETAAAIISGDPFSKEAHPEILSNVVVSQIDIFKAYGGVIPEVAARSHLEAILPVIHQAFKEADFTSTDKSGNPKDDWGKIDAIAVTHTPGLLGSLLIGTLTARTLAILHNKPLYAVHHLKSHIYSNWLGNTGNTISGDLRRRRESRIGSSPVTTGRATDAPEIRIPVFPILALVISGGHTQIIRMTEHNHFEIIGTTYDDAVGECFDKVAKILGLPYPGGPSIAKAAKNGDPKKYHLPHPQIKDLDFSFSGLKTAVLRAVQKEVGVPISYPSHQLKDLLSEQQVADFAASFEQTACEILLEKLEKALEKYPDTRSIVLAGGVSANNRLREKCLGLLATTGSPRQRERTIGSPPVTTGRTTGARGANNLNIFFPELCFSGDNAAMVGAAAFYEIASGVQPTDPLSLNILPRSSIK
ncbi:tRNA (adenosine(37)-N6)-threonylcarbamoyltransferase complex transferase subunit TsaD [Candidatus Saccharibacteria bacterium]|nr:tRNA (adenosine(37)-N6)-threonylcarbamoyltransferase complex transferase subunit TsaD [Candidatus Saccharibacteria bacterium]